MRLTIVVALIALAALVAVAVIRLDDRNELSTELITAAPAPTPQASLASDVGEARPDDPGRVAVIPDKSEAQASEWEAASVAAVDVAETAATQEATSMTVSSATSAPAASAAATPQAQPPSPPRVAPAPAPTPAPTPPPSGGGSLFAKLDNIARCESGMNAKAYNPAGPYLGAFQFHLSTWQGLGESGDPRDRSYSYQRDVAARLQQRAGWGSWPHCSAKYGY